MLIEMVADTGLHMLHACIVCLITTSFMSITLPHFCITENKNAQHFGAIYNALSVLSGLIVGYVIWYLNNLLMYL